MRLEVYFKSGHDSFSVSESTHACTKSSCALATHALNLETSEIPSRSVNLNGLVLVRDVEIYCGSLTRLCVIISVLAFAEA